MKRTHRALSLLVVAAVAAVACSGEAVEDEERVFRGRLARVLDEPEAFDGRRVVVRAFYFEDLDQTVLTDGLRESYPPQATEPNVWVMTEEPDGGCLRSDVGITWGEVLAEGRFRFDPEGRFGPLGVLTMELENAQLRCP